ncbi:MAG TPA: cupredoxin family copper-binding protein [Burkholderiaceae bacterium]|nr:cupredoxin family copper-binding protein [Burkholderiaceae bacterium]
MAGTAVIAALVAVAPSFGAETHTIAMEGMKFAPASLTVKRGDAVVWVNRDLVAHTATASGAFDSGPIAAGKSWRFVARAPGRHEYVCSLHPTMKATLVVE